MIKILREININIEYGVGWVDSKDERCLEYVFKVDFVVIV